MNSYVLKWNPAKWPLEEFVAYMERAKGGEVLPFSCGNTKKIAVGDEVFLMKVGEGFRGIIGRGTVVAAPYELNHFDVEEARGGRKTHYVDVSFDFLEDPGKPLPIGLHELESEELECSAWTVQGTGKVIPDHIAEVVGRMFDSRVGKEAFSLPDELANSKSLPEGAKTEVVVNHYERSAEARRLCLEHHGYDCSVCGANFWQRYGDIGRNYIHVHHIVPIANIGEGYQVNPQEDLVPVCPNCHAMLHARKPDPYSIDELRAIYSQYNQ